MIKNYYIPLPYQPIPFKFWKKLFHGTILIRIYSSIKDIKDITSQYGALFSQFPSKNKSKIKPLSQDANVTS